MKKGFTLAETIIAIAIIGIVAAITIPSVIQQYKKAEASAKLKKFYSTMKSAIAQSEYEHGVDIRQFEFSWKNGSREGTNVYWAEYFAPYLNQMKFINGVSGAQVCTAYMTDGTIITFNAAAAIDVRIDINGNNPPNAYGRDKFLFFIPFSTTSETYISKNESFAPAYLSKYKTREDILKDCAKDGAYCTALLMWDNWEFKSDYPWKL